MSGKKAGVEKNAVGNVVGRLRGGQYVEQIGFASSDGETAEQILNAVLELDDTLSNAIASGDLVEVFKEGGIGVDVISSDKVDSYLARGYRLYNPNVQITK